MPEMGVISLNGSLNRFPLVLVNSDGNRPLNEFDGNHQRVVSVACDQESFDAVQRATTNSHALTDLQERTECVRNVTRQKCPKGSQSGSRG